MRGLNVCAATAATLVVLTEGLGLPVAGQVSIREARGRPWKARLLDFIIGDVDRTMDNYDWAMRFARAQARGHGVAHVLRNTEPDRSSPERVSRVTIRGRLP